MGTTLCLCGNVGEDGSVCAALGCNAAIAHCDSLDWWLMAAGRRWEGWGAFGWLTGLVLICNSATVLRDWAGASHWLRLNERDIDGRLGASLTTFLLDGLATTWSVSRSLAMMSPFCKDCSLCRVIVCPDGRCMSVFLESIAKPLACSWFRCMASEFQLFNRRMVVPYRISLATNTLDLLSNATLFEGSHSQIQFIRWCCTVT